MLIYETHQRRSFILFFFFFLFYSNVQDIFSNNFYISKLYILFLIGGRICLPLQALAHTHTHTHTLYTYTYTCIHEYMYMYVRTILVLMQVEKGKLTRSRGY